MAAAQEDAATFVLIHGAWHGGWCWERLASSLEARGHSAVAMDLPAEDGTATFLDYARSVLAAIPSSAENVILVGHSLGGMALPLVAALRPVRALVYLCAVVPRPGGTPWDDGPPMAEDGVFDVLVSHDDGSTSWPSTDSAGAAFYSDCSQADSSWAFQRLRRQNSSSLWLEPYPLVDIAPVKTVSIAGTYDRAVVPAWSRHSTARLGVELIELPTAHSPFLSQPELLASTLIDQLSLAAS